MEIGRELCDRGPEQCGIFACGPGVVNGARADEDEQSRIALPQYAGDIEAGIEDGGDGRFTDGKLFLEEHGWQDDFRPLDTNVFYGLEHGPFLNVQMAGPANRHSACFLEIVSF
jgi:hypothetical protein